MSTDKQDIEWQADEITEGVKWFAAENLRLHEQVADLTDALLAAIEVIHTWNGKGQWKIYYHCAPEMKPIREVLERSDSVGTYEPTDG